MVTYSGEEIKVFTTCPPYQGFDAVAYLRHVRDISRWSDQAGCDGILVYTDNGQLDPWLVSQVIVESTDSLMPLVAVQPVYMHPYSVAKAISTIAFLYRRRVCLNMVAGGFKNDLAALNDLTPHARRYDRLIEYTRIIQQLLAGSSAVTFHGEFYDVQHLSLTPPLPAELSPLITISGSSAEGMAAARALGAIPVKYPEPPETCQIAGNHGMRDCGIRVGIIARPDEEAAWQVAYERFPTDRAGEIRHSLAMKTSDSVWHKQLSALSRRASDNRGVYWLEPFQNYKTFCPYLVGSYSQVASEIGKYLAAGHNLFILDVPVSAEELAHIGMVFTSSVAIGA